VRKGNSLAELVTNKRYNGKDSALSLSLSGLRDEWIHLVSYAYGA